MILCFILAVWHDMAWHCSLPACLPATFPPELCNLSGWTRPKVMRENAIFTLHDFGCRHCLSFARTQPMQLPTTNYYNSNILVLYAMQCGECDGIRQPMLACPAYFFFLSSLWYLYRINVVAHHIVFDMLRKFIKLHSIFIYELHLCRQVAVEEYLWAALHQERLRFFFIFILYICEWSTRCKRQRGIDTTLSECSRRASIILFLWFLTCFGENYYDRHLWK